MASANSAPQERTPPLGLPLWVWLVIFTLCGVLANLFHDALIDPVAIAAYLLAAISLVIYFHLQNKGPRRSWFMVGWHGLFLGIVLFLCTMFAWVVAETASRGRSGEFVMWPLRMSLAYFYGAVLLLLLMRCKRLIATLAQYAILSVIGIALFVGLVYSLGIAGPGDTSAYPPARESPYCLPWKAGTTHTCTQGNLSVLSHGGWQEYAYDFIMPVGTEVCAARAGQVAKIIDEYDENGFNAPGNYIVVAHYDGSYAEYVHIRKGGRRAEVRQHVQQGDVIAESGNVGYSLQAHLHFHVVKDRWTIPVSFADVSGDGIPRTLRRYMSGNPNR